MKRYKNKFIIVIISLIIWVVWYATLNIILKSNIDRSSYVVLLDWQATLNTQVLEIEKKTKLVLWDNIKTIWDNSLAVIKWWDWSITRLWWNSVVIIKESNIDDDLLKINISFKLEKWKSWSNVISFIWKDSYFHQEFADTTAAVRWTVYEVNLEKDYLYVESHEVKLTSTSWNTEIVSENKPFIISEFDFSSLINFIKDFQDNTFRNINLNLDKEFYKELLSKIWNLNDFTSDKISDISNLTSEKKSELYNKTLKQYQKLNFIKTDDISNYKKKLEIKERLINLSDLDNKKKLLRTTLYDFKKLVSNKQFSELKKVTSIITSHKSDLGELDIRLENYIDFKVLDSLKIPDSLKKEFENSFTNLKNILNIQKIDFKNNPLIDSAKRSINDIKENLNNIWNKLVK